jgi:tripartite motif-containing protein 71
MRLSRNGRPAPGVLGSALTMLALLLAGAGADSASAEGCAGSGPGPCPYASAQIIGQRAEGVLRFPEAVAVDTQGNVYVADQLSYVVQKFTAAGAFETEWGSYGGGHGQFGPIGGIATDSAGNVYVVDSSHNRIEKFDSNGNFITAWGHTGSELGQFHFFSSQNPTQPPGGGIAVGGSYVYVADSGNNRIERFNLEGGEPLEWGSYGFGPGQFSYPRGVAANASEVIVTDDDNHRIEKFDPNGVFQSTAGSNGTGPGQFGFPYGAALDAAGNVYVADDINHRVVKLNPSLGFLQSWGGFGTKIGQLAFPRAIASDPAGDTYVADTANDRIQVFNTGGAFLHTLGASARAPGVLTAPLGLAIDPTGRLFISDSGDNRIETFAPGSDLFTGTVWNRTGGRRTGFSGPAGIGIDPRGTVYIADRSNQRIAHVWGDGTYLSEVGGPANLGGAQLSGAGSVAVSPGTGMSYVADTNHNRVLVYSPGGTVIAKWGAGEGDGAEGSGEGQFNHPGAVALDPAGNVYVADTKNNRIVELNPGGSVVNMWGSRGTGDGRFRDPAGVAVDAAHRVYVVDSENNRVQVFGPDGHFLERWGLRGFGLGEFSQPTAIGVDCNGDAYVADTNNNRVERFNLLNPAATGCAAAGTWPPPLDVAPTLQVSLPRASGILARRALALTVSCKRGCQILVTATLSPAGRRGPVKLVALARKLPPALTGHVRLRLGPASLRRLQRELGRRRALTARVRIVAAGPTGRRSTVTRSYALSR